MEETYSPEGMLDSYLYECFQLLEQMESIVLSGGTESFFDTENVHEMFRILHTIKGTSGIMMYDSIGMTAHKLEDIFYYLRESAAEELPKSKLSECIFQAADFMSGEWNKIREGKNPDGNPEKVIKKIEDYLAALKGYMQKQGVELPPENVYVPPGMYYNAPHKEQKTRKRVKIDLGMEPDEKSGMNPGDYVIVDRKQWEKDTLVGIRMEKLEELTVLSKRLVQLDREAKGLEDEDIKRRLHEIVEEIGASVRDMRKTPIATAFRRMNRVMYDVSRRLSKSIELMTGGEEILIDRLLAEQLTEPLMHMVRNAADHGIESIEERKKAGKEPRGTIWLSAEKKKNRLYLSVRNDGRELDAQQIFERAKEKGLIEDAADIEDYTEEEIFLMITRSGFSTTDTVTEISGRGIGMDIVASRLAELGGALQIRNIPGEGVEMIMEIPVD